MGLLTNLVFLSLKNNLVGILHCRVTLAEGIFQQFSQGRSSCYSRFKNAIIYCSWIYLQYIPIQHVFLTYPEH